MGGITSTCSDCMPCLKINTKAKLSYDHALTVPMRIQIFWYCHVHPLTYVVFVRMLVRMLMMTSFLREESLLTSGFQQLLVLLLPRRQRQFRHRFLLPKELQTKKREREREKKKKTKGVLITERRNVIKSVMNQSWEYDECSSTIVMSLSRQFFSFSPFRLTVLVFNAICGGGGA